MKVIDHIIIFGFIFASAWGIHGRFDKLESKIAAIPQITVTNITNNIEKTVTWPQYQPIPSVPMPYYGVITNVPCYQRITVPN